MVEVSVIVPIYNSGKYLRKCLLSLAGQTFSKMEVILIDDGSTDLSRYICETFLQRIFFFSLLLERKRRIIRCAKYGDPKVTGEISVFCR